jgi:hypothetical protein
MRSDHPPVKAVLTCLALLLASACSDQPRTTEPSPVAREAPPATHGASPRPVAPPTSEGATPSRTNALVTRVIDGDTFEALFGGRQITVRLIGIDTPGSVAPGQPVQCYARAASDFTRRRLEGHRIRLEARGPTALERGLGPLRFAGGAIARTRACASRHRRRIWTARMCRNGGSPCCRPTPTASTATATASGASERSTERE